MVTTFAEMDRINEELPAIAKQVGEDVFFTGWKTCMYIGGEPCDFVGQWIAHMGDRYAYVNLPGMESGWCAKGDSFPIGEKRISATTSRDERDSLIYLGLTRLKEIIHAL